MFLDELQPFVKQLTQQPVAFLGGFVSGVLRLKLTDDPLKEWLEKQGASTSTYTDTSSGNGSGPQSISIE
jgi:hypothetical protein